MGTSQVHTLVFCLWSYREASLAFSWNSDVPMESTSCPERGISQAPILITMTPRILIQGPDLGHTLTVTN